MEKQQIKLECLKIAKEMAAENESIEETIEVAKKIWNFLSALD